MRFGGFGVVLLVLLVAACERTDPLAYYENPAGDREVLEVLIGSAESGKLAICVMAADTDACGEHSADILVQDYQQIEDVDIEWVDNQTVRVTVASGKVMRDAGRSRDGSTRIELVRDPQWEARLREG